MTATAGTNMANMNMPIANMNNAMLSAARAPRYRPCLACGTSVSTNRPLSYHLKKGVRKHLPSGICYYTETGKRGELPPLSTITDANCMCLACVKIIDTLLARLDKMPLRNGSQHAPIVRPLSSPSPARLAPVKTVGKPKRRIPQPGVAAKNANLYGNTTINGNINMNANANSNIYTTSMPITTTIPKNLPVSIAPAPINSKSTPPPKAPPTPTTGVCIICNLSSSAPSATQPGADININLKEMPQVTGCTLSQLRDQVIERVGSHLSTLESTVRIFRAARVELAEGVCTFDSRAFATHLLNGHLGNLGNAEGIICTMHHSELLRAAEVKAAGALPCAICGEKPTLSGGDEVRSLAPFIVHHQNMQDGNDNGNSNILCDTAMGIMRGANLLLNEQEKVANFIHHFHAFLEKEFACSACHRALEEKL